MAVQFIEVTQDAAGQWGGTCAALDIYSVKWPIDVLIAPFRDLMERQVTIHLAGGIAEAIHHGVRRGREALRFAEAHMEMDLTKAEPVLRDVFRVTGYDVGPQHYADRTLLILEAHWPAVTALAAALIENGRIEGKDVERIIDRSIGSAWSTQGTQWIRLLHGAV